MNKQLFCFALIYVLFFLTSSLNATLTEAQFVSMQLSASDIQIDNQSDLAHKKNYQKCTKEQKANPLKKKDFAKFEQAYALKKEEIVLFEEAFSQAPHIIQTLVKEISKGNEEASQYKMLLLTGPSGSGKSTLAKAIVYKLGRNCKVINAPSLLGHYRDQAAEELRKVFNELTQDPNKPVLVVEEINALTDDHTSEHSDTKHTAMQLWVLLDKHQTNKDFFLIGTTNITKKMPHQLQSRFKGQTFLIDNPTNESRKRAILFYLNKTQIKKDETCNEDYIEELSKKTVEFSQRDLETLIKRSLLLSAMDYPEKENRVISKKHLEQAYKDLIEENDKFWDFKEHTTDEERRHRENTILSEKQFKENQEFQIMLNEWNLIFQIILKSNEPLSPVSVEKGITAVNNSKKLVFPDKKPIAIAKPIPGARFYHAEKNKLLPHEEDKHNKNSIEIVRI